MANIDFIADGESGLSVRDKLNNVHDQIILTTTAHIQVKDDDAILFTVPSASTLLLLSVNNPPDPEKQLVVINESASVGNVTITPFAAETINGAATLVLTPGTSVVLVPALGDEWKTLQDGAVDTLYTADGIINGTRAVSLPSGGVLTISSFDQATVGTSTLLANITIDDALLQLSHSNPMTATNQTMQFDGTEMLLRDTVNSKGLVYAADYSAAFTDESLVSKRYVDTFGLTFVVGKSAAGNFIYNTIQSAIDAANLVGEPTTIIVMPGAYTEDITITKIGMSLFSPGGRNGSTVVDGTLTVTLDADGSFSTGGIDFLDQFSVTGTNVVSVLAEDCLFEAVSGSTSIAILLNNAIAGSLVRLNNCEIVNDGTAQYVLEKAANNISVTCFDCFFHEGPNATLLEPGSFLVNNQTGGSIDIQDCILEGAIFVLTATDVEVNIRDTNIKTTAVGQAFPLFILTTFTGEVLCIGGLFEVEGAGGNVIQPATGANFTFSNVSTTANTILNTTQGTRLDVDGVALQSEAASDGTFLDITGGYSIPASSGAQLSSATVQIFDEADIIAAFGAGPVWTLANVNLQVMENITLTTDNSFKIDTTSVTITGVDRNSSSITGDSSQPLLDFTAASGSVTDLQLRLKNLNFTQNGIGSLLREDGTRFIVDFSNCGLTGNTSGGDINLLNGQFIGFRDGVPQGGSSIIQGDGTTGSIGVEFIFFTDNFLGITDLFADGQRWMELLPNSVTRRLSTAGFSIQINPDFVFVPPRTDSVGIYIHKTAKVEILTYMNGGLNPIAATSSMFVVEDADSVDLSLVGGNTYTGAGQLYQFSPSPAASTVNLFSLRGCGFDADNNMIGVQQGPSNIFRYAGTSSTITDTMTLGGTPTNVTWYRGNLVHLDAADEEVMLEDGFPAASSPTATVDLSLLTPSLAGARSIATDGTRIFIGDSANGVHVFGPDFFTATTPVELFSFIVDGIPDIEGMDYDGVNLWVVNTSTNQVVCLKGVTPIIQFEFSTADGDPVAIAFFDEGYVISDSVSDNLSVFLESPTIDHSSRTWQVMGNVGDQEQIKTDPIDVAQWTTAVGGTISDAGGILTLTNGAASAGEADFSMPCIVGHTYTVTNGYTPGTSVSATSSILDEALATVVSETVSVAGNVILTFTAPDQAMTFRFKNTSIVITEDSILTSLSYIDTAYKIVESSDKGGSIFSDLVGFPISPVLADGVLSDISDSGTDIFYAPFSKREKSRLGDEQNGMLKITSVRDRGISFQGSALVSGGSGTNQYEMLVVINGDPQEDSVGTTVTTGNNDVRSFVTQLITRDVTDTDEVKLQIRPVGNSINLTMMRCALSSFE